MDRNHLTKIHTYCLQTRSRLLRISFSVTYYGISSKSNLRNYPQGIIRIRSDNHVSQPFPYHSPMINSPDFSHFHPVGVRTSYTNNTQSKLCSPNLPSLTSRLTASDSVTVSQPNSTLALQVSTIHEKAGVSAQFGDALRQQNIQLIYFSKHLLKPPISPHFVQTTLDLGPGYGAMGFSATSRPLRGLRVGPGIPTQKARDWTLLS